MRGYETHISKSKIRWRKGARRRLVGYFFPLFALVSLVLWLRPQNAFGWLLVAGGFAASWSVPLLVLCHARREVFPKRPVGNDWFFREPRFVDQGLGEVNMMTFLRNQPGRRT
jgi:hypothetical protein